MNLLHLSIFYFCSIKFQSNTSITCSGVGDRMETYFYSFFFFLLLQIVTIFFRRTQNNTHFKWTVLYMRIPSATPHIWIISSFDIRSKSAPEKWAKVAICWPSRWWFIHWTSWEGVMSLFITSVCNKWNISNRQFTNRNRNHIRLLRHPVALAMKYSARCASHSNWTTTHCWCQSDCSNSSCWTWRCRIYSRRQGTMSWQLWMAKRFSNGPASDWRRFKWTKRKKKNGNDE